MMLFTKMKFRPEMVITPYVLTVTGLSDSFAGLMPVDRVDTFSAHRIGSVS